MGFFVGAGGFMRKKLITASIASDQTDLDLKDWLVANTAWDGVAPNREFEITVNAGVTIDASSRTAIALDVAGFPTGSKLTLLIAATAMVTGAGSIGGRGGDYNSINGKPGLSAGHAIQYDQNISVGGSGTLQGGGGGGGGGSLTGATSGGGGGGGGAGKAVGTGGSGGTGDPAFSIHGSPGSAGTLSAGGAGGLGGDGDTGNDKGGTGGAPGANGSNGQSGPGIQVGGTGGAAGKAATQVSGTFTDISGGSLTINGATA